MRLFGAGLMGLLLVAGAGLMKLHLSKTPPTSPIPDQQEPAQSSDSGNHPAHYLWQKLKPTLGDDAPDFTLHDLENKEFRLKDVIGKKPIVIEFGSYS